MDASVTELFEYTRARITAEDIVKYSPGDPGYYDYVQLWDKIWRTGEIPRETEFALSEVIGLTGWTSPEEEDLPERFRAYRRFTTSVAVALVHFGTCSNDVRNASYLARDLIIDLDRSDPQHLSLLRRVVKATREVLISTTYEEGYPYFTFASMILAQIAGDWKAAESAASQLIFDDSAVRHNERHNWAVVDNRFLFGLNNDDLLEKDWLGFAQQLQNPNSHEDTQLVIDALKHDKIVVRYRD